MSKLDNFKGKEGTNSFKHRPKDAAKYGGRPKSLKKRYTELMDKEGSIIWVEKQNVNHRTKVIDGEEVEQVGLKLSSRDFILAKLDRIIATAKPSTALNAIQFIWKQESEQQKVQNQINIQNNIESNGHGAGSEEEATYIIEFF